MEPLVESTRRAAPLYRVDAEPRAFATVVLDADLELCEIDGIEWLADRRGSSIALRVAALGAQERAGVIAPRSAYASRLAAIKPNRDDVDALSRAYVDAVAPATVQAIGNLRRAGVRIVVVSRGPRNAMYRLAYRLGIEPADIHAVDIRFDALGTYAGYDESSPLAGISDPRGIIDELEIERPVLIAGDAMADRRIDSIAQLVGLALR
jgi:phosphoserine phosphatase